MTAPNSKRRADELLFEAGLAESRTKAQAFIMAGVARVRKKTPLGDAPWELVKKAGQMLLAENVEFAVDASSKQDVGRGAQKLRHAFQKWPEIRVKGAQALDVGASTGGFTQVLLEFGAESVLALDVGTHQLHERLRADKRVYSLEQQHVLKMSSEVWAKLPHKPPFDVVVTDVSFISVIKIVPTVAEWIQAGGSWVVLVKPQFEVGPKKAPGGIVRNEEFRQEAIAQVKSSAEAVPYLRVVDCIESPISGGDGNVEYLMWIVRKTE